MLEEDSENLRNLYKKCKDAKEKIRYLALYNVSRGKEVTEIAEMLDVDRSMIYDWVEKWNNEKNLHDKPKSGRPPQLSEKDKTEIKDLIDENNPKIHGINARLWSCRNLRLYFIQRHHRDIPIERFRCVLKDMGAHYIKATFVYREGDEEKKREFAKELKEILVKKFGADTALLFLDEMSVCTSPHKGYGWTFNQRLVINVSESKKERANCFGAVDPLDGNIVQMVSKNAKVFAFIKFLFLILRKFGDKTIFIMLDNCMVHHARKVQEFLKAHPNIRLVFLPPYSPDINPQELMWNYKRAEFLNNHPFNTFHQLATSLSWFVKKLDAATVRSVCSLIPIEMYLS